MPPTVSRPHPVDVLLSGHHFRVSQARLQVAGADIYDKAGLLIMAGTGTADTPRPRTGGLVGTALGYRALCADHSRRCPGALVLAANAVNPVGSLGTVQSSGPAAGPDGVEVRR
jgi:hypothetical protein